MTSRRTSSPTTTRAFPPSATSSSPCRTIGWRPPRTWPGRVPSRPSRSSTTSRPVDQAVRAVRLEGRQPGPVLREVPRPDPGPGEVLVKVDAAGLCHSDVHMIEAPAGVFPVDVPFTLGHETAGTVAALGAGVTGVAEGQRVLVYSRWGCGACWQCVQGRENLCERSIQELGG